LPAEGLFRSWPLPYKINQKHPKALGTSLLSNFVRACPCLCKILKALQPHKARIFWLISSEAGLLSEKKISSYKSVIKVTVLMGTR
jgi:hypothetical protein